MNKKRGDKKCAKHKKFDLYAFVAGEAAKRPDPFPLKCNCGGVVTVMPPFQDEFVICPRCESSIKMLVLEGDPGYVFGADPFTKEPILIPVQGSSKEALSLTPEERVRLLERARKAFK